MAAYFWKFKCCPHIKKVQLLAEVKFSCSAWDCPRFSHHLMVLCLKVFGWSCFLKTKTCRDTEVVPMKCPFKMKMKSCWYNNVENYGFGAWQGEKKNCPGGSSCNSPANLQNSSKLSKRFLPTRFASSWCVLLKNHLCFNQALKYRFLNSRKIANLVALVLQHGQCGSDPVCPLL